MRISSLLPSLAVAFATTCRAADVLTPSAPPQFETLFVGKFIVSPNATTFNTPYGSRLYAPVLGGNFTDPSGKLVATMLPGTTDTSVINTTSGLIFPQGVIIFRWEVDGTLAYISTTGVGFASVWDMAYMHLETDSETYSGLNSRFLVGNVSWTDGPTGNPTVTIFGAV